MEQILPKNIKSLLKKHEAFALKKLGQNFLISQAALAKIIKAADLKPTDTVLEVGSGTGILTKELAEKVKKVVAVEKDKKMCQILEEALFSFKNVKIVQEDILKLKDNQLPKKFKVVANLPYYITSPVIRKLLELESQPEAIILTVQKEVAQRICSQPPDMNLLAVSVQFYARPKIISFVSKGCFWPQPKVDSAILKLKPQKPKNKKFSSKFFKVVRVGFSQPRKQLINNLSKGLGQSKAKTESWLLKNNIEPGRRAETLTVKDWENLSNSF